MIIEILKQEAKKIYVAKPTDTYASIAQKLDIDEQKLREQNNNQKIFIGKKIYY